MNAWAEADAGISWDDLRRDDIPEPRPVIRPLPSARDLETASPRWPRPEPTPLRTFEDVLDLCLAEP